MRGEGPRAGARDVGFGDGAKRSQLGGWGQAGIGGRLQWNTPVWYFLPLFTRGLPDQPCPISPAGCVFLARRGELTCGADARGAVLQAELPGAD
jgi:hypothetical protein